MEVAVFSSTRYERRYLDGANRNGAHKLHYFDVLLDTDTAGLAARLRRRLHLRQRQGGRGSTRRAAQGWDASAGSALHGL